jgi:hypothetical protein
MLAFQQVKAGVEARLVNQSIVVVGETLILDGRLLNCGLCLLGMQAEMRTERCVHLAEAMWWGIVMIPRQ